jgi:membrane protein
MNRQNELWALYGRVLKESAGRFFREDAMSYAAALAFFMVFSLPPILLIIIWIAGIFSQDSAVREAVLLEFSHLIGEDGTSQIGATLDRLNVSAPTGWSSAIAGAVVLFSATAVLNSARKALNRLFSVKPTVLKSGRGLWIKVRDRMISIAMLIVMGFMVAVSMSLDAMLALLGRYLKAHLGAVGSWIAVMDSVILRVLVMSALFSMLFRYVSDLRLPWKDTLIGALLTAMLFAGGGHLIGEVVGRSTVANYYDAAGSLLVLMLWVHYASALLLFGATFTFVRADLQSNRVDAK